MAGRWSSGMTFLLSLLLVASFAVAAWSFYNGHSEACKSRNATLNVLRDILADASAASADSRGSAVQRDAAARFYRVELSRIETARC